MATQDMWCFCTKCYCLFFYGVSNNAGVCAAGGRHSPLSALASTSGIGSSVNFELNVVSTSPPPSSPGSGSIGSPPGAQDNWRFCTQCYGLFFYGFNNAGRCPVNNEQHSPLQSESLTDAYSSWDFELQIAAKSSPASSPGGGAGPSSAGTQANWRFCTKCYSLFWYGYPTAGVCPAGGQHSPLQSASPTHAPSSWDFELPIASTVTPPLAFATEYQQMTEWCWIACAVSVSFFYTQNSAWSQCQLLTDQLLPPYGSSNLQGTCCPGFPLIDATPGLGVALANPYSVNSKYVLMNIIPELPATPTSACNHSGGVSKALTQTGNLNGSEVESSIQYSDLADEFARGRPVCITITWPPPPQGQGGSHQIVASAVEDPDMVLIHDPANGLSTVPYDTLISGYQGNGTWVATDYTQPA